MSRSIDWNKYHAGLLDEARAQFQTAMSIVSRSRGWHDREQRTHTMHPAVVAAFNNYVPANWQTLLLEWPHVSQTDRTRLAYTRDERSGIDDRQTVTTVGKYLTRHFPGMPDHITRDLVAKYATAMEFRIVRTPHEIVDAVQRGPSSCMQWSDGDVEDLGHHPYEHYDPKYGWHMAVGYAGGQCQARALLMQRDNLDTAPKYFVRTYQRKEGESYSQPSEDLKQWLIAQGYVQKSGWNHERLSFISGPDEDDEVNAPYIDGSQQHVEVQRELDTDTGKYTKYLRITGEGDYDCTGTNGKAERENGCTCDDCGRRVNEDDQYTVGEDENCTVGDCCIDDYTRVIGRRGYEYYVPNGHAVDADGDCYHDEYLSDNNIVCLHNGDYTHENNATWVASQNEYYPSDDVVLDHNDEYQVQEDCVQLHNGEWALDEETWQCAGSDNYYLHYEDTPVEVDGEDYHEDHVPETDDEEEDADNADNAEATPAQTTAIATTI